MCEGCTDEELRLIDWIIKEECVRKNKNKCIDDT